jgi:hypothetical protein
LILTALQAPGEVCAELAHLNQLGWIDFVYMSNSDVFVFGATEVIRRYVPLCQLGCSENAE